MQAWIKGESMQKIIIDEEFKTLLPALDKDTYALLEENLIQNGCRDSIVLWGNILIDGHNRYEICSRHDIAFNTINKDFGSREEALIWIISTQVSRRNLTPIQLSHFRGLHYMADKKLLGRPNKQVPEEKSGHSDHIFTDRPGSTANRLAGQYNVSPKTIRRDLKVASAIESIGEVSPPAKKMILSGEAGLDKKKLGGLSEKPKEEIEAVAAAIENGTYEKQNTSTSASYASSISSTPSASSTPTISSASPAPSASPDSTASPSSGKPVDSILAKIPPLQLAVNDLSDSLSVLPKIRSNADRTKLRAALRPCIDQLEDLYRQIQ